MAKLRNNNLVLWYNQPAQKWTQALPLGNGRIGAMVYGDIRHEMICLNEDTLWSGVPRDTNDPTAGEHIRKAALLTKEGRADQAQILLEDQVLGTWGQSYMPLGNMELLFEHNHNCYNYYRELDLERAVTSVVYTCGEVEYRRECFVTAIDDGMVLRLTASKPEQISFTLSLTSLLKNHINVSTDTLILQGECPGQVAPNYVDREEPIIYSDVAQERGIGFYAMVKVSHIGGSLIEEDNNLKLKDATEVTLYFTVKTSFDGFDKHPFLEGRKIKGPCEKTMQALMAKPYQELIESHVTDYQSYFKRVDFYLETKQDIEFPTDQRLRAFARGETDDGLYMLLFQYGRYLLISSSRPGTQAANLQGIWNDQLRAPWSSNYTVNINTQMNYWPAFSCNLGELNAPLLELIKDISKSGRKTAKVYYNARGFTAHHNIDLWRITTPVGPRGTRSAAKWGFWPMGAAWLCRHVYDQYEFSGDLEYLRNEALPLLKAACLFCLDLLTPNEEGHLWVSPATSPENEYYLDGLECGIAGTSTMTMTILRDLFKNCIKAFDLLGEEKQLKEQLQNTLPKLYPYRVGSRGQLLEWNGDLEGTDPHHRHVSHLYGLHPANEFTFEHTPELIEACKVTLNERGDDGTGWSLGWKINHWARLRDGDHALKLVKRQLRPVDDIEINYSNQGGTYDNLFDAHPPFQIDGNFGVCAGIAEMLLQSHEGFLHLLPALPKEWAEGHIAGLVGRGNVVVSLWWQEGVLKKAQLSPLIDGTIIVQYQGRKVELYAKAGDELIFNASLQQIKL